MAKIRGTFAVVERYERVWTVVSTAGSTHVVRKDAVRHACMPPEEELWVAGSI
jgi:hypothetical protein